MGYWMDSNIDFEAFVTKAKTYLEIYIDRLKKDPRPQQSNPFRRSVQEHIFYKLKLNKIKEDEAIQIISNEGFNDVVPRFQSFGRDSNTLKNPLKFDHH